ncbi:transposase [Tunicatimonas pelagia]|nr:transposase [Tunicatimonas pelagia]WKN46383.1 transposase [Tunicatimonas pelagia]
MARMEDILDLYQAPIVPGVARLCFDERPCQLLGHSISPLPVKPGQVEKQDHRYIRQGTCVLLLAYDIDQGLRYLQVRKQRTKRDYAECIYWLTTTHYAHVDKIKLVQDNLNTHQYGAFYERYTPAIAHAMKNKIEFHFTPKHASWLNSAEIEFSAIARQAISQRVESIQKMKHITHAWQEDRNQRRTKISWSFTTLQARTKMKQQYRI